MGIKLELNIEKIILFLRFIIIHVGTIFFGYFFLPNLNNTSIIGFIWFGAKILLWLIFVGVFYSFLLDLFQNILNDYMKVRLKLLDRQEYNTNNLKYHIEDSRMYRTVLEKLYNTSSNYKRKLYSFQLFCIKNWIPLGTFFLLITVISFMILR